MTNHETDCDKSEFAVPEFWVLASKSLRTDPKLPCPLYSRHLRFTPEQAQDISRRLGKGEQVSLTDTEWGEFTIPGYVALRRATWRDRDAMDGIETCLGIVWREAEWWHDAANLWRQQGVIRSKEEPAMLAYYTSLDKARRGIRTRIRPGRYLAKFFVHIPEKERARLARWQETGNLENEFNNETLYPLLFATTGDDIANVYMDGPHSCMSNCADDYETDGEHPTVVYAAGDLAIAYLHHDTGDGEPKVQARTLCWPDKKVFGRVYPTPDNWRTDGFSSHDEAAAMQDALRNRLLHKGWHEDNGHGFNGARITKISIDDDQFVMPFFDNGYGIKDADKHFVMRKPCDVRCDNTDGRICVDIGTPCDACGDRVRDPDDLYTVVVSLNADGDGREYGMWCGNCYEHNTFFCRGIEECVSNNYSYVHVDDQTYSLRYAENNFTRSDWSGDWFDGPPVLMASGEQWSEDEFERHGFTCEILNRNFPDREEHSEYSRIHESVSDEQIAAWLKRTNQSQETENV